MTIVFVGLGSNLGEPKSQLRTAITELDKIPATAVTVTSSLYNTTPHGPQDQPEFVNAVAKLETGLKANILLEYLQQIEQGHHRQRTRHWGPRTLDLDILLFGDMKINDENLIVPHPHIASRGFVLYPLLEIAPDLIIPGLGLVTDLIEGLDEPVPARAGGF